MRAKIKEWVEKEFETIKFKSKRLEKRFLMAMSALSERPDKSIWLAAGSRANAKAIYRMLRNEKFDKEEILSAHRRAANARGRGKILLAVQDTMSVNYGSHKKTKGLGYNCEQSLGINAHSCLLVTPEGIPVGLLSQEVITRAEASSEGFTDNEKRMRPIEEKESYRWLKTMKEAAENAPEGASLVHVADREGDIYELFALAQEAGEKFVIRAAQNRLDVENEHIISVLRSCEPSGSIAVTVPANRQKKTKERDVALTVQYQSFDVKKPQNLSRNRELAASLKLNMVRVSEEAPADGVEPLEWLLITNLEVKNVRDAGKIAGYYRQRWKIERLHFVLKSGCEIEKIQQRSVEAIELMVLMYSIISIHIMQFTFLARNFPDTPCDLIFEESEWRTLYKAANRTKEAPESPYSMADAARYAARLGGFAGAKSDGPPGLKVIWIGLNSLFLLNAYRDFL